MARTKLTLNDLKALYGTGAVGWGNLPGDPNQYTPATKRGHIHIVRPSRKPVPGKISPAQFRRLKRTSKEKVQHVS